MLPIGWRQAVLVARLQGTWTIWSTCMYVYMYVRNMCQSVTGRDSVGDDDGSGAPVKTSTFQTRGAARLVHLFPAHSKFTLLY